VALTGIGKSIVKALSDSKVSKSEVEGLIKQAMSNKKLSAAERKELTTFLKQNGDKFDASATAALTAFLGAPAAATTTLVKPEPAKPAPIDPKVLKEHEKLVSYNRIPGAQLYVDGVNYDDVLQGSIGDCFFVSSLSAVAYSNPQAIKDAIKDNGDGTYTVRFYKRDYSGKLSAQYVTVDDDLPSSYAGARPKYAKARDGKEIWVSILEKAYAGMNGGYDAIGSGGRSTDVMTALTGVSSSYYTTKANRASVIYDLIKTAEELQTAVTAVTHDKTSGVDYTGTGVYAFHMYTVLGAVEENGVKYVKLRNPWGSSEHGNDGKNDGIFKMKLEDFCKLYQGLNVN